MSHRASLTTERKSTRSSPARKPNFVFALFVRKNKKKPWEKLPGEIQAGHLHEAIMIFVNIPEGRRLKKDRLLNRHPDGRVAGFNPKTTHLKVDYANQGTHHD